MRHLIHPTENIILELREEPKFLETLYRVPSKTQSTKSQKVLVNDMDGLIV